MQCDLNPPVVAGTAVVAIKVSDVADRPPLVDLRKS